MLLIFWIFIAFSIAFSRRHPGAGAILVSRGEERRPLPAPGIPAGQADPTLTATAA